MVLHNVMKTHWRLHQNLVAIGFAARFQPQFLGRRKIIRPRNNYSFRLADQSIAKRLKLGRICPDMTRSTQNAQRRPQLRIVNSRERIAGGPGITATGGSLAMTKDSR